MTDKPQIGINWGKVGGRKFVAAFVIFGTAISNGLFGNMLDIKSVTLATLGFLTFIIVEGIIDFRRINGNGDQQPLKATMSGKLKQELKQLHMFLKKVAPDEYAELIEGKKATTKKATEETKLEAEIEN